MPKAEVGSVKHLNKQMKQKGLTRLRWYCQICEKACRDENAFKQHTLSESHVRQALVVGRDARPHAFEHGRRAAPVDRWPACWLWRFGRAHECEEEGAAERVYAAAEQGDG